MAKVAIAVMPCQCCGHEVVIKENERKTLSYACQWCDDAPYQRAGTGAYDAWRKKMGPLPGGSSGEPVEPAPEKPAAKPEPAPAAPPAKKKTGTFF